MAEIANTANQEPWPSLETASWWFDKASIALVGSLLFGLVATVIIVWMGITKEHHWDLLREQSEREIAGINKQAEQLRADAEASKADIAKANERASVANQAASEANKIAEGEKLARVKLEIALAPRRLSTEQRKKLSSLLSADKENWIGIAAAMSSAEAQQFALDFKSVFEDAGWKVRFSQAWLSGTNVGISIASETEDVSNGKNMLLFLKTTFAQADLSAEVISIASQENRVGGIGVSKGHAYLFIGEKSALNPTAK